MNLTIFIPMLFGLQLFYWYIGRRALSKTSSQNDYYLAGKSVTLFPLMMTFLATQVGGGLVLGTADEAYKYGFSVLLYPLGAALGLILLGSGIGRKLSQLGVSTIAELFEVVYGSRLLRKLASGLSVVSLFMILVGQIIASHKFLISLGIQNNFLFIAFWAIVIIYTVQGGLRAVISTDKVQAVFFSVVFLLCLGWIQPSVALFEANFAAVSSKLMGWLLMPLLFMVIEQDMAQRCFAGASPKTVSRASLFAGIATMIICFVPVILGVFAKQMGLIIPPGGSVLMTTVSAIAGPWMLALVGSAILAAVISTVTSLINAISSNLSIDFQWKGSKMITAIISILVIFFAFFFDNVVDILIKSYDLSVSCLFVPIFFALFKKRGNFLSALLAILMGAIGFFIYPIAGLVLSLLGYCIGEIKSLKPKLHTINSNNSS